MFNEYIQNWWFYHENSLEWVFVHFAAKNSLYHAGAPIPKVKTVKEMTFILQKIELKVDNVYS